MTAAWVGGVCKTCGAYTHSCKCPNSARDAIVELLSGDNKQPEKNRISYLHESDTARLVEASLSRQPIRRVENRILGTIRARIECPCCGVGIHIQVEVDQ